MKQKSKWIGVVLCMVVMVTMLGGCKSNQNSKKAESQKEATGTHSVVDHAGNEVEVPNEINRIVILDITPLPSVYCMIVGDTKKIVGMTPASQNVAVNSLLTEVAPELADVETGFAAGETINTEELLSLNPDVIFYRMETQSDVDAISKLSIPAVAFSTSVFKGNTIDTLNGWVELLASVFDDDSINERASKIIQAGEDAQSLVTERVKNLTEEEKTKSLVLHNYDESGIKAGGTTFAKYYLDTVGANNVGSSVEGLFAPVTLEQIYEWNPKAIFLNSFSKFSPDDFYHNTAIEGDDWSGIDAVKNQRVYKYPIGMYYWFPPCSDSPLSIQWVAKSLYPDLFEDIDMEEITRTYYKDFYGIDLTDEQLNGIFNPSKEAAFTP
ncbi:MAG: ABC transporter substrate-binding protein [Velocimicrobium sp.]